MKRLFVGVLLVACLLLVGVQVGLPYVLSVMPGAYRVYVPEEIVRRYGEALPTALPTVAVAALPQVTLPPLLPTETPTATETAVPSPTLTVDHSLTPEASASGEGDAADAANELMTPTVAPTETPTPTATAVPLPASVRLDQIEVIPQKFNNCGPTNLTMVLGYFGHETEQLVVGNVLKPNREDRNVSPWELVGYVETQTELAAFSGSGGDLALLKRLLAAGYPVIVEKGVEENAWQGWLGHYVTLVGYEEETAEFITFDTLLGPWDSTGLPIGYEELEVAWQQFNYTFVVLFPPSEQAQVMTLLGDDFGSAAQMWQRTATRAQAETMATPDNAFAWFNLGTSLMALGRETEDMTLLSNAALAFDQARAIGLPPRMLWYQFEIYEAYLVNGRYEDVLTLTEATLSTQGGRSVEESYLYQGHALLAQGDLAAAKVAYERALSVNPNLAAAEQALLAAE